MKSWNIRFTFLLVLSITGILAYQLDKTQNEVTAMQQALDDTKLAVAQVQGVVDTQTQMNVLLDAIIVDGQGNLTIDQMIELRDAVWTQAGLYAHLGLTSSRILAVIRQESAFLPTALSNRDAYGLMQVTPPTAMGHLSSEIGAAIMVDPALLHDITFNLKVGVAELMRLHAMFVSRGLEEIGEFHLSHTAYFWGYGGTNRMLATNGESNPRLSLGYANSVRGHERQYREGGLD